eukprot:Awhi_evm1s14014
MAEYIISVGKTDVNNVTKDGETALFISARMGNLEVVKYLISVANADVDKADSLGRTPLYIA